MTTPVEKPEPERPCAEVLWEWAPYPFPTAVCSQPYGTEHSHADHTALEAVALGLAWPICPPQEAPSP